MWRWSNSFWLESRPSGSSPLPHRISYQMKLHTANLQLAHTGFSCNWHLCTLYTNTTTRLSRAKQWRFGDAWWCSGAGHSLSPGRGSSGWRTRSWRSWALGGRVRPIPHVPGAVQNPYTPEPRWPWSGFHIQGRSSGRPLEWSNIPSLPDVVRPTNVLPSLPPWEDGGMTVSPVWHRGGLVSLGSSLTQQSYTPVGRGRVPHPTAMMVDVGELFSLIQLQ